MSFLRVKSPEAPKITKINGSIVEVYQINGLDIETKVGM